MRHFLLVAAAGALLSSTGQLAAALNDEIIPEVTAQRYGLTRMWVTQAQVNRAQGRLQTLVLYEGTLYAQSNRAVLEGIDAETGQKLWSKMIGQPTHPTSTPSAHRDLVATINGSTLFVMNRYTGDILYQTLVNGAPGGGPALSSKRVYVPMVTGMIVAYRLDPVTDAAKELAKHDPHEAEMSEDEKKEKAKKDEEERRENIRIRQDFIPPLACSSAGRILVPPVVITQNHEEEYVTWVTDRGFMYVGRIDRRSEDLFLSLYRLTTNGTFSSPPAYLPPLPPDPKKKDIGESGMIYGGSSDGYLYALAERNGELQWKFPMSDPVIDSPVVLENRVYATTELGGMFCLDAKTSKQIWWAPEVLHFVAAGKQRVYAADKQGRLRILDSRTGALVDMLPTTAMPIMVSNGQTDRIYLATEGGTIQCLREVEQTTPIVYNLSRKPPPDEEQPNVAKMKSKIAAEGGPKVAHDQPAKKPAKKDDAKPDDAAGFGEEPADKPAKPAPAKAKAAGGAKAKAGAAKKDAGAAEDPFDLGK